MTVDCTFCFGRTSDGKWWWAIVDQKLDGRTEASGYDTEGEALDDLFKALRRETIERVNTLSLT